MYEKELKEFERISWNVGNMPDMVQGGGGNTSVKLDGELMAVKASGYMLKQITTNDGYVVVNYKEIKKYYENVDLNSAIDYEKDSTEFAKKSIVSFEGLKELRPSVEAGFHSILKKYVIHSHSVYANILCCTKNGREQVDRIFSATEQTCLWIPYINPGFSLTLKILEGIGESLKNNGKFPEVIFMENHGLIINCDDCERSLELNAEVNQKIRDYLGIKSPYPEIGLKKVDDDTFASDTAYLSDYFKKNRITADYFDKVALYPDQLVYLNGNISVDGMGSKLNINTTTGEIIYKTGLKEAQTMEETLLGYIYVIDKINQCGLPLKTMSSGQTNFIKNWESESYRKGLVK